MTRLTIRRPDDFHLHLRILLMLQNVLRHTADHFARALIMPNPMPPIVTSEDVTRYQSEILAERGQTVAFEPLMTFFILPNHDPRQIGLLKGVGVLSGKGYPKGLTTNSDDGIEDYFALYEVYAEMEKHGLVLCLHGEKPGKEVYCLDREKEFLPIVRQINQDFPKLRIVVEHVSTAAAIETVLELPDAVAATITAHHPALTTDDIIGGKLKPHLFCKPVAKRPEDREAIVRAMISGSPKFFFGSDSAPHPRGAKECAEGCAGLYTAPVALAVLSEMFEKYDALDRLENFVSRFGAEFYSLPLNEGTITLEKKPWKVPTSYFDQPNDVVPFRAGEELQWQVVS